MKVKNISSSLQSVTGIPTFEPGEVREVTNEQADTLLRNPNFVKESASEKRRKESLNKNSKINTEKDEA